ncbi:MAG TPA: ornithine carbamoyltransferase, partial [Terriglobales bacterium]|nr:ornithine carbamoyltransferase [Terriglobales bacterium]
TRVSFETAMAQFGGHALFLSPRDSQLGRGEPIEDSARVLSRMVDLIMIRTTDQRKLWELAHYATVPVINGLTDQSHPCQLMADVMTYEEHRGPIRGKAIAWSGDGNNMATSWIHAAVQFDFELRIACPAGFEPAADLRAAAGNRCLLTSDPRSAAAGADLVVTDVWASMGQEWDAATRLKAFQDYQVNSRVVKMAKEDAVVMHCLPAHRGQEITDEVIEGPQSIVFDQAENRLHAQKAVMAWLLEAVNGTNVQSTPKESSESKSARRKR